MITDGESALLQEQHIDPVVADVETVPDISVPATQALASPADVSSGGDERRSSRQRKPPAWMKDYDV